MSMEEDDHVTQRRTRIETETAPVRDLSPAQGEVPVPGPGAGRPPAHPLLRLLPVPAGSAPRTVPRGPRGAPVSVPPAPDASTDRPSSDHARPPGDTEHDGATEAGDPTMRVTSSWLTEAAGSVHTNATRTTDCPRSNDARVFMCARRVSSRCRRAVGAGPAGHGPKL